MSSNVFQRIYTKLEAITKATVTLRATDVSNDELAMVAGRLAQVVKIKKDLVTLQVFAGTEGIPTNAQVEFFGEPPALNVGEQLSGRFLNAYGEPIDGGPKIEGERRYIGGPSVNPYKRKQPSELIPTGIAGIDLNNTLVSGQKIPFFADPDQPYNQVMADVALRADVDKIILGGMGLSNDDYLYFRQKFEDAGALDKIICFINTTEQPPVERLLIPDMALTAAEYFAVDKNEKVLVLLTDMTLYADALSIVSNRMDQIPSKDSMPGSLYSDLAKIYEKAVQLPDGGSITIIAVTTLNDGDITHAIPDNTGYITEGQLYLRKDTDTGKIIVDPFRSLSRLKQLVINKKTREDHSQVMNTGVRLFADAANAKTKLENGFDLSDYDLRCLEYAKEYSTRLLSIDVNIKIDEMLDTGWMLFKKYFKPEELGIKQSLVDKYWNR
ncbi:MAG: V-type ATP synthase subunit B [Bacteroidales bacterium]|jgi:V/A-type H+-transporting ATPase subunit B|nr:V-type ATP synthase subunit B [Bacteroidales bacterium]MBR0313630.1 V-type ATP synthase subunit B [Bacteroidales bacterium]MBR6972377.1 V-type ATP synthase subunit B [Bacteroidales bacterium]